MVKEIQRFLIISLILALISSMFFYSLAKAYERSRERKIVVFKKGVSEKLKKLSLEQINVNTIKDLDLVEGKVVILNESEEKELLKRPEVLRIDPDVEVYALENNKRFYLKDRSNFGFQGKGNKTKLQPSEVLTWNIDRVDAEISWSITTGNPVKVGVIDTGIQLNHPDLQNNVKGGYSAVWYTTNPNDDNGHGTHVAGIIAALDNEIGVIGVGPEIDLYAIKVLDRKGSGYLSDVIEGIDWAIQNRMQVINMSLGTSQNVQSFHEAIQKAYNNGITIVAAAGNNGGEINYPAAYQEVIAVSATDQNNQIASWSSRGTAIDLTAPGVDIYSAYRNSSYRTLNGTSMAAPHVAAAAALIIDTKKCDLNSDGTCTPLEVQERLEATAIDLGNTGKDNLYGFGLVNVYQALIF